MKPRTEAALSGATTGLLVGMYASLGAQAVTGQVSALLFLWHVTICAATGGALAWGWAWAKGGEG